MQITERKIDELIHAEYNPRELTEEQEKQLSDSLRRFGVVDPVLVNVHPDRKDIIIGGHQRSKVWKKLGNETIPTVELSLSLDQEKELNVRLNKNTGQFDMDMLKEHFNIAELVDWGFEEYEFEVIDSDEPDYSLLDDEDLADELDDLTDGVKKAIQIEFDLEHYEEASELVKFWRDQDAYVGAMIIEKLKEEKEKL
jgi:ParB-like chromosome segregation protein Spo0J